MRNSKKEIVLGQQALFEEIVKKGNTVVLSYNQLTDSEAFLYAVKNPDTYAEILKLFSLDVYKRQDSFSIKNLRISAGIHLPVLHQQKSVTKAKS